MRPKVAAAIITGTMARPSRPSVRLTALPAPAMTKMPTSTKNGPSSITTFLKNGTVSTSEISGGPSHITKKVAMRRDQKLEQQTQPAREARDVRRVTFR